MAWGDADDRGSSWDRDAARRERKKAEGMRKPEWRCCSCSKLNYQFTKRGAPNNSCRGCGCVRDVGCATVDRYGVEHAGRRQLRGDRGADWDRERSPQSQRQGEGKTKVQKLRDQLRLAREGELPDDVVATMAAKLATAEKEARDALPIGKRLDAARSRLKMATDLLERKQTLLEKVKIEVEDATAEVGAAHATLLELMQEEASDPVPVQWLGSQGGSVHLASALSRLLEAVRAGWPVHSQSALPLVPRGVAQAAEDAEAALQEIASAAAAGGEQGADATQAMEDVAQEASKRKAEEEPVDESQERAQPAAKARPVTSLRGTIERAERLLPALRTDRSRSPVPGPGDRSGATGSAGAGGGVVATPN